MAETLVEVIHVGVALFMVLVVLVQGGNQGGVGAAFGGGSSSGVFGATGATSLLGKMTYGAAGIFMITSVTLTVMQGKGGHTGLGEKLKQQSGATEVVPTSPAGQQAAPANAEKQAAPAAEQQAPATQPQSPAPQAPVDAAPQAK